MIYQGKRYGIFDKELDFLIERVYEKDSLSSIEAHLCPQCSAPLKVGFYPDGKAFVISCEGKIPHSTQYQAIDTPPTWWQERVVEVTEWLE